MTVTVTTIHFKENFERLAEVHFQFYTDAATYFGGMVTIEVPESMDELKKEIIEIFKAKTA
jgi:hypothetical protein